MYSKRYLANDSIHNPNVLGDNLKLLFEYQYILWDLFNSCDEYCDGSINRWNRNKMKQNITDVTIKSTMLKHRRFNEGSIVI